jgi:putative chitinase
MATSDAQAQLQAEGLYSGAIDNDLGPMTMTGCMMAAAGIKTATRVMTAIAPALVAIIPFAGLTTPLRLCHALAQWTEETDNWESLVEYGPASYFAKYDGRADLGNSRPGDGYDYRGRGPSMVTGRVNYTKIGEQLGVDLVGSPDLLATDMAISARSAAQYWINAQANDAADQDDVQSVTRRINGGLNGLSERQASLARLKAVWGLR